MYHAMIYDPIQCPQQGHIHQWDTYIQVIYGKAFWLRVDNKNNFVTMRLDFVLNFF